MMFRSVRRYLDWRCGCIHIDLQLVRALKLFLKVFEEQDTDFAHSCTIFIHSFIVRFMTARIRPVSPLLS
jgi:hypothetical protein